MHDKERRASYTNQTGDQPFSFICGTQEKNASHTQKVAGNEKDKTPKRWRDLALENKIMCWLTFGIFLIAGVTAVILKGQFSAMDTQTGLSATQLQGDSLSSLAQLREMRHQTEVSERPWLSVEVKPKTELIWLGGTATLRMTVNIRNVGHSIAKNIHVDVKMFPDPVAAPGAEALGAPDAFNNQRQVCEHPKGNFGSINIAGLFDLFAVPEPVERTVELSTTPAATNLDAFFPENKRRKFVGLYVVGCITYGYSFADIYRQTDFAYDLNRTTVTQEGRMFTFPSMFEVGVNVPVKDLVLTQKMFGVNRAD